MKRFIDCLVPFRACNLRCSYCCITHTQSWGNALPVFPYDAEHIGRSLSADRLGGISLINISGEGETLLPPEMPSIIYQILKQGHYVMLVTNGTVTSRLEEISAFPTDMLDRLLIKYSFHYIELKKRKWLAMFFDNVINTKKAGCSISVELTPCDEMIPYIDEIIDLCKERVGAMCHVTVARDERNPLLPILTKYPKNEYAAIWNRFQSELFEFKLKVFGEKRKEYCYAGLWSVFLDLVSGRLKQCYSEGFVQNIYEDLDRPINYIPVGAHCSQPHCYNAHAYMTLGIVPSVPTPTLAEMRNRICEDGTEWLTPNMKKFLSRKLIDANRDLSKKEKLIYEFRRKIMPSRLMKKARSVLSRIR